MILLTLGGVNIFGVPLECRHNPAATAQQVNAFFGVSGTQAVFGGSRGRSFMIKGLYYGDYIADIRATETVLETYADGVPRVLAVQWADGSSYAWPAVIFKGEYQQQGDPRPEVTSGGYVQAYQMVLHGLI
jgi:hypothetical protein